MKGEGEVERDRIYYSKLLKDLLGAHGGIVDEWALTVTDEREGIGEDLNQTSNRSAAAPVCPFWQWRSNSWHDSN